MFKKLFSFVALIALVFVLAACGGERTYAADGVYTAYELKLHDGAPQVVTVSVTIKNDKIESFFIDSLQSKGVEGVYNWNAKTKKELGYAYRMQSQFHLSEADYIKYLKDNDLLEWFEQANLLEAYFLEHGPSAVEVKSDGNFKTEIAGVTMADESYVKLAEEAVQNAIDGKAIAYVPSKSNERAVDFIWVTAKVDSKGKFTELVLDTLQSKVTEVLDEETEEVVGYTFAWNPKTKQELKEDYNMKKFGPKYEYTGGEWKVVADAKPDFEWYEQANKLTDYVLANGIEGLSSLKGQGLTVDGSTVAVAGVTVETNKYLEALNKLYNLFK